MQIISTENEKNSPVFIWGEDKSHGESARQLFDEIRKVTEKDFSLAAFEVTDWNSQFSPWATPVVFGKEGFAGDGKKTLDVIEGEILAEIKKNFPEGKIYLAGYSLAGLFSLWAMYESEMFDGAACCSSSLWFEKWDEFAASHEIAKGVQIYMSLGNREEKTKNKVMAKVGERTRNQVETLKNNPNVEKFFFEWNEGGHFDEPLKRLAKGIGWLINNIEEK